MLKIIYRYKDSDRTIESEQLLKHRNYEKTIAKAKLLNLDIESEVYVSEITNLNAKPRHTTCLSYSQEPARPYIKVKSKNTILGNNPFDCIYAIPFEDDYLELEFWNITIQK